MNKILKYLSIAAIMVPVVSCTEEKLELMEPATLLESVSIVMDNATTAKLYTDASTGSSILPMVVGESISLDYSTVPEDLSEVTFPEMQWSSSNESTVSVTADGVLTANAAGSAVITITSATVNVVASASVTVNVVESAVATTGIDISCDNDLYDEENDVILCYMEDILNFSAVVTPEDATYKSVLWSVDNEELASIDAVTGTFTAIATGRVTVTATSLDATPVTESTQVEIITPIDPEGIRINNAPADGDIFSLSQMTFTADYDEYPQYSTVSRIVWTSSNENVATVEDGVVTFKSFGTTTITATCPGDGTVDEGFTKTASFTIEIPAGYYNDIFSENSWLWWENDSASLAGSNCEVKQSENGEWYLEVTPGVQNTSNWRCDIQRIPDDRTVSAANAVPYDNNVTFLDRTNYPIICIRIDDIIDHGGENRSIFIDVNNGFVHDSGSTDRIWFGRLGGSGANHWETKYLCSDGSALLIYNLETQSFQTGGQLQENNVAVFPNFKIGYADIRTFASGEDAKYRFFWFKTFQSEDDLNAFLKEWSAETGIKYE